MVKKRNIDVTANSTTSPKKEAKDDRTEVSDKNTKEQRVCSLIFLLFS